MVNADDLIDRASRHLSATPRPFIRWAGSKRFLLPTLLNVLPLHYRTYREPFLGGGSLFFLLQPDRAVISDSCSELIDAYKGVRAAPHVINNLLAKLKPDPEYFYALRKARSSDPTRRAAEFIYLNKTCWNGLFRVNSRGEFNVPYGQPKTDTLSEPDNVLACAAALGKPGVTIACSDFAKALEQADPDDLVFLDPPYVTSHNNNGFVDYNETLFSWDDQLRLADVANQLAQRGVYVVVTNAFHQDVLKLYRGFHTAIISRHSTLASNKAFRREVSEAVLYSGRSRERRRRM